MGSFKSNASLLKACLQILFSALLGMKTQRVIIWVLARSPFPQNAGVVALGFRYPFSG